MSSATILTLKVQIKTAADINLKIFEIFKEEILDTSCEWARKVKMIYAKCQDLFSMTDKIF